MKTKLLLISIFCICIVKHSLGQSLAWALTNGEFSLSSGTIISMDPGNGFVTVHHIFLAPDGYHPNGDLTIGDDGNLYGTCYDGGAFSSCTIFKFNPATDYYDDVYDFDIVNGDYPMSGLVKGNNGVLYGATKAGGANGLGVLYSWNTITNSYTVLHSFSNSTGSIPFGNPIIHSNGKLYGLTTEGGANGEGVIYSFDVSTSTYSDLHDFGGINGSTPKGSLCETPDGKLYGLTYDGGNGQGILFRYNPVNQVFTNLFLFNTANGAYPKGSLIRAGNGLLYGTTSAGGSGFGNIFSYDPATGILTNVFSFSSSDGFQPLGSLTQSGNKLYGTASRGGMNNYGTAFSFDIMTNTFTLLHEFDGVDGATPNGAFLFLTPTGLQESSDASENIYPNPTNGMIRIPTHFQGYSISIKDMIGNEVSSVSKVNSTSLDISNLPPAIYLLEFSNDDKRVWERVVKY